MRVLPKNEKECKKEEIMWIDVLRDFERMQNEMGRALGHYYTGETPRVNVYRNDDNILLQAEVPGVSKDDLDITISDDVVTLKGKQATENTSENVQKLRSEIDRAQFTRTIELPDEVDSESVEATLKNGVLTLTLPVREERKPKKITVQAQ